MTKKELNKMIDTLDEAHTLLAKSSIETEEYKQISRLLIEAKDELRNEILEDLREDISPEDKIKTKRHYDKVIAKGKKKAQQ